MKRFTDGDKWTKNKWFRMLENEQKIFWLFILDHCDPVGVWEEDIEFFELLTGISLDKKSILSVLDDRVKIINGGKKWWIVGFCDFQYGELKEENTANRPHQSYIAQLKKHSLWIDYKKHFTKSLERLKEKEKDKDKETDKEKEIPEWEEFKAYAVSVKHNVNIDNMKAKYDAWILDGWKDGKGKIIKNWKSKVGHNIQYWGVEQTYMSKF